MRKIANILKGTYALIIKHVKQYDRKFKHGWVVRKSTTGNLNAMFGCKNTTDQMNNVTF